MADDRDVSYDSDINTARGDITNLDDDPKNSLFPANKLYLRMGENMAISESLVDDEPLRTAKTNELEAKGEKED